jgi:imidazolonepropionase-like amidohydrolase
LKTVGDAGIPIAIGTDTGFPGVILGVSSLMEVVLHVEAGLTPQAALRAATSTAAAMIGREKDLGTVEPGKLADLVVLDADPLADVRNIRKIHRVVKGGVIYDPAQLITVAR